MEYLRYIGEFHRFFLKSVELYVLSRDDLCSFIVYELNNVKQFDFSIWRLFCTLQKLLLSLSICSFMLRSGVQTVRPKKSPTNLGGTESEK